jgi:hypothetical protein
MKRTCSDVRFLRRNYSEKVFNNVLGMDTSVVPQKILMGMSGRTSEDHEHTTSRIWGLTCENVE